MTPVSLWENKASSSLMGNSVLQQVQSGTPAECLRFLSLLLWIFLSLNFDVILVVFCVLLLGSLTGEVGVGEELCPVGSRWLS